MSYSTDELLKILEKSTEYPRSEILTDQNLVTRPIGELLSDLLQTKEMSKAQCIKAAGLDRTYCYQIFDGTKLPSRDKVLALLIAASCNLKEIQTILKHGGYPMLYPRHKRDTAIIYGISHRLNVMEINELLYEIGFETL